MTKLLQGLLLKRGMGRPTPMRVSDSSLCDHLFCEHMFYTFDVKYTLVTATERKEKDHDDQWRIQESKMGGG